MVKLGIGMLVLTTLPWTRHLLFFNYCNAESIEITVSKLQLGVSLKIVKKKLTQKLFGDSTKKIVGKEKSYRGVKAD